MQAFIQVFIDEFFKVCPGLVRTYQNMLLNPDDESKLQIDKLRKLVDDYEWGENYD